MLHALKMLLRKMDRYRYRRGLDGALALHWRGEARNDGLETTSVGTQLSIEWRARDIHPWDHSLLSAAQKAATYVEQALLDTEAAIYGLFDALPQVDTIALRVLDRESGHVILGGTIARPAAAPDRRLSIGMRLRYLGVTYYSAGSEFEILESYHPPPVVDSGALPVFARPAQLSNAVYRRDVEPG
jgi:hypothetical protein